MENEKELQNFKKILEYFVLHMSANCNNRNILSAKKDAENESGENTKKKEKVLLSDKLVELLNKVVCKSEIDQQDNTIGIFNYNDEKVSLLNVENDEGDGNDENDKKALGGHGYNEQKNKRDKKLQSQLDNYSKSNDFYILDKNQKICISIDTTGGYKGGSYLHWVDIKEGNDQSITQYTNGTNINPVFEITQSKEQGVIVTFIGLEVGPSQNSPTFVFAPMYFSFDDLGLFNDAPSKNQEYNLFAFFEYYQEMRRNEIKGALTYKGEKQLLATKNMILTGAPGTGKTWSAKNIAAWMIKGKPYDSSMQEDEKFKTQCRFVQFHPSYDYTDFVEGLRPVDPSDNNIDPSDNNIDPSDNNENAPSQSNNRANASNSIGFKRVDGIFKNFCKTAYRALQNTNNEQNNAPKFVFIIDEINRGEMSKILGELFYSIDPGYRGIDGKVNTQYQNMITDEDDPFKDGFFVPENVYIIGTMNDIDRSVESMDFAMRRRFSFLEVKANEREDMWTEEWKDLAKACMEAINEKIDSISGLSSAYHIGPAYFKKLNDYKLKDGNGKVYGYDFFKLWDNHLYGVLFEYLRGKNNSEATIDGIFDEYIKALINSLNQRFNKGGSWGKLCFKDGNVTDKAKELFNKKDTKELEEELKIKKLSDIIKNCKEELEKRSMQKVDDSDTQEENTSTNKKSDEAKLKQEAKARAIDKVKIMIERAMKHGKEIETKCKQEK